MYPFPEMREFFPPLTPGSVFVVASSDPHLAHAVIRQVELSWRSRLDLGRLDSPVVPLRHEEQSWETYLATARRTAQRLATVAFLPVSLECPDVPEHMVVVVKHGATGFLNLTMLWNGRQRTASYRLSEETGVLIPTSSVDLPTYDIMQELFVIEPSTVVAEAEPRLRELLGESDIRLECIDVESSENHVSATLKLLIDAPDTPTDHTITATGIPDGYGGFASFHLDLPD